MYLPNIKSLFKILGPLGYTIKIEKIKEDTLDTEGIFRLIESVPSPKAEPFKVWLAKLGRQKVAKRGGSVAKGARNLYEKKVKKSVISSIILFK